MSDPLVTIGIPTYKRPKLLKRALEAVVRQNYKNLEVIVSDNATPGSANQKIVDAYIHKISNLKFVRHSSNIGAINNFTSILNAATGEYFMWLADDDEISSNYISKLVQALIDDKQACTATASVILMSSDNKGRFWPCSYFPQASCLYRVIKFLWNSDDAFFYGLHRTSVLREATFQEYIWPNKKILQNVCYSFLIDLVLRGKVINIHDHTVQIMLHTSYVKKEYCFNFSDGVFFRVFRGFLRRLNVYLFYFIKIYLHDKIFSIFLIIPLILIFLYKEIFLASFLFLTYKVKSFFWRGKTNV